MGIKGDILTFGRNREHWIRVEEKAKHIFSEPPAYYITINRTAEVQFMADSVVDTLHGSVVLLSRSVPIDDSVMENLEATLVELMDMALDPDSIPALWEVNTATISEWGDDHDEE